MNNTMNNKELTELERIAEIHNYDTELDELLDCPFCGGRPVAFLRGNEHLNKSGKKVSVTIRCPNCRIERTDAVLKNSIEWLKEVAIKNWNNRSSVPSNDEIKREAVEEFLKSQIEYEAEEYAVCPLCKREFIWGETYCPDDRRKLITETRNKLEWSNRNAVIKELIESLTQKENNE